ncbi:hypothetical protein BCY86_04985 [Pajaroellobacter abortibovis]|uniref:D-alanine--D-alanine ligase C-terminal domain-containing protein n=1 Tax=Pajaroellobacter abortibovis TaxID=1882918 RepID=A0A1L6MXC2_9BACT|nr:hypothetical protein BCY86_04985 [Pajaroellobacter abortibovis]
MTEKELGELEKHHASFGFPVTIRLRNGKGSVEAVRVDCRSHLVQAVVRAFEEADHVLIERWIDAHEIRVALVKGRAVGAMKLNPEAKGVVHVGSRFLWRGGKECTKLRSEQSMRLVVQGPIRSVSWFPLKRE